MVLDLFLQTSTSSLQCIILTNGASLEQEVNVFSIRAKMKKNETELFTFFFLLNTYKVYQNPHNFNPLPLSASFLLPGCSAAFPHRGEQWHSSVGLAAGIINAAAVLHFKIRTAATARHGACKLQTKALVSSSYCDGATMPFLTDAANIVMCADEPPHCVLRRMGAGGRAAASTWEFTCKAKVKVTHVFTS